MIPALILTGVLLLWWKLHRMTPTEPAPAATVEPAPTVYRPIKIQFVEVAPELEPGSYRDDTTAVAAA